MQFFASLFKMTRHRLLCGITQQCRVLRTNTIEDHIIMEELCSAR